jgi:Carboxypeptidase regulatory-like domain/TonB dependent receptor
MFSFLRRRRSVLVSMFGLVLITGAAEIHCFAQAGGGGAQVSGVVRDSSGAPIAGAQVKLTQTATQLERGITTDVEGRYVAPALPVGPYQLEVSVAGFKTYSQVGIILQVGDNVEINASMQVGETTQRLDVTAQASMVETRDNTISQVVEERRIVELPLNGRQSTQLVLLTPGTVTPPNDNTGGGDQLSTKNLHNSVSISVAGIQGNGVNYLLDGAPNNDASTNVSMPLPFPDALQEFSVQTSGLPARYGYHPSAVVNAVTKSGTNEWHGDLFEFLRNGSLNARSFFAPTHDNLKRNQFGGTVGGKIIKDKLFFFAGYQATRNRQTQTQNSIVPTAAVLNGDFSVIDGPQCVSGGKTISLTNPTTGKPFAGNQIPVSMFDPASLALSKYLPAAQNQCGAVTYGIFVNTNEDQGVIRGDWLVNSKNTIYMRSYTGSYRYPLAFNGNILANSQMGAIEGWEEATIGETYTITPNILNAFHASFTRRAITRVSPPGTPTAQQLGINAYSPLPDLFTATVSSYFSAGCASCTPNNNVINSFHYGDDVDIIKGKHQIGFGVNLSFNQFNGFQANTVNGLTTFNGQYDTGKSVNDALAAFFLGAPNQYQQSSPWLNHARQTVLGFYIQDSYKVTPRLTINAGLRLDPMFPTTEPSGISFSQANFDSNTHSTVYPNAPAGLLFQGDPGIPDGWQHTPKAVFSPRVGLAWDPTGSGKQSFRLGAGILRNTADMFYMYPMPGNAPYGTTVIRTQAFSQGMTFSNPWGGYPGGNPFPQPSPIPQNVAFLPDVRYRSLPLEFQPMYVAQWNVSYQRQFAGWLATVTYIGSKSTHLTTSPEFNPGVYIPGSTAGLEQRRRLYLQNVAQGQYYGTMPRIETSGNSNYNALLLSLQHRFSHGFIWQSNYTWSHCLSDVDNSTSIGGGYEQVHNRAADYGNCYFDIRNNFNTSLVVMSPVKGGLMGAILGGWQVAPIVTLSAGLPTNILDGSDVSQTGVNLDRPNYVAGCDPYLHDGNPVDYYNRACFQVQPKGTYGNLGRNVLIGPGAIRFDVSLIRTFRINERWQITPRFEAYNVINHTNFSQPNVALNSSTFGVITNVFSAAVGGGATNGTAQDPRILQLALKVVF